MFYRATMHLKTDAPHIPWHDVVNAIDCLMDSESSQPGRAEDILTGTNAPWDDSFPERLAVANATFPGVLFTLLCTGEEGEHWVVYAKNGSHYSDNTFTPPFDELILTGQRQPARNLHSTGYGVYVADHLLATVWDSRTSSHPSSINYPKENAKSSPTAY